MEAILTLFSHSLGSVTTNGTDTTATIGMHPPEVTTGITEIGTGVTVPLRTSEGSTEKF